MRFPQILLTLSAAALIGLASGNPVADVTALQTDTRVATQVVAGESHTCALNVDTTVFCWGSNVRGQLGDGTNDDSSIPVQVCSDATCTTHLSGIIAIVAGSTHLCGIGTSPSVVKCWGSNTSGQLGDNTTTDRTTPMNVCLNPPTCTASPNNVDDLAAGTDFSCLLKIGSAVVCWGENSSGQLGDNTTTDRSTPLGVCADPPACLDALSAAVDIEAGAAHACAITDTGGVQCWGDNSSGQLGDNQSCGVQCETPVEVCSDHTCSGSLNGVQAIALGDFHTCYITANPHPNTKCTGSNQFGQIGDNGTCGATSVAPVSVCEDVLCNDFAISLGLAAGGTSNSVIANNPHPAVRSWGDNSSGQLGDGTTTQRDAPVKVCANPGCTAFLTNVYTDDPDDPNAPDPQASIAAGGAGSGSHTCALGPAGLMCWGANASGQLGDGTTSNRSTPDFVQGFDVVGGMAELPDVAGTPLEAEGSSGPSAGVVASIVAAVAVGVLALGGAAWYARRRLG